VAVADQIVCSGGLGDTVTTLRRLLAGSRAEGSQLRVQPRAGMLPMLTDLCRDGSGLSVT